MNGAPYIKKYQVVDKMLWPENRVGASPQTQTLARFKAVQEYKGLKFYSVEDLRQKLTISTQVSAFATRLVITLSFNCWTQQDSGDSSPKKAPKRL